VAGLIVCKDASLFATSHIHGHHLRSSTNCDKLSDNIHLGFRDKACHGMHCPYEWLLYTHFERVRELDASGWCRANRPADLLLPALHLVGIACAIQKRLRHRIFGQASRGPSAHKTLAQSHTCSCRVRGDVVTPTGQSSDWSRACLSGAPAIDSGVCLGTDNLRRCDNEPAIALEWPCLVAQWLIDEHDPDDGTNATFRRDSNGDGPTGRTTLTLMLRASPTSSRRSFWPVPGAAYAAQF